MEDRELRERLDRIEAHLGMIPYVPASGKVQKGDKIEELLVYIDEKKIEVKDKAFCDYLNQMESKLLRQKELLESYEDNLCRNYDIYISRQEKRESELQRETADAPLLRKEPIVAQSSFGERDVPTMKQPLEQPMEFAQHREMNRGEEVTAQTVEKKAPLVRQTEKKNKDVEFKIGAVVLSVVGALFIIASLVIFGLNYMDNIQQGIFFYMLAGLVVAFSEFVIRRHLERFAQAITGIGVCILYTATILNYLYLKTMGSAMAIIVTVLTSVFALLLSRKRESSSLRIIGILGCYISLMPLENFESAFAFIIPSVILFLVNGLYLFLPVEKENAAVRNVHATANMLASVYLMVVAFDSEISMPLCCGFVLAMLVIHYAIYYNTGEGKSLKGFYVAGNICFAILLLIVLWDQDIYIIGTVAYTLVAALGILLERKKAVRWSVLHSFACVVLAVFAGVGVAEGIVAVTILFVCYHVLFRFYPKELAISNIVMSVVAAVVFLFNMESLTNVQYALLAVIVCSVIGIRQQKTFTEILIMSVLWGFGLFGFDMLAIALPLSVVLLLACMAFFTKVDAYRCEKMQLLVIFAWIYNAITLLACLGATDLNISRISMTIVLLTESMLLMVLFSEEAGTKEEIVIKCRTHALSIFFTYMVFVYRIELPIVVSILLMIIAVASVAAGFLLKMKSVRVYGLCMSLFVCGKLLLVDFADAQSADKVISFLVVGVIALAISYIYMRIERSLAEKENL